MGSGLLGMVGFLLGCDGWVLGGVVNRWKWENIWIFSCLFFNLIVICLSEIAGTYILHGVYIFLTYLDSSNDNI